MLALIDSEKLTTSLILHENGTVEETNSKELSIWTPVTSNAFSWSFCLINTLSIRHPKSKIDSSA